jgi:hypothetical protein
MTITDDVQDRVESQPATAVRLVTAALSVGLVGGIATAGLATSFGSTGISPAARVLAIGTPLVLLVLIGRRLATGAVPADGWLGGTALVSVVVTALVQAWPELGALGDDPTGNAVVALGVVLYGAAFGLAVSLVAIVMGVPVVVLLRASRIRLNVQATQLVMTVVAMAVTAPFVLWVTTALNAGIVTGLATALAGTGAVITGRWCLVGRTA